MLELKKLDKEILLALIENGREPVYKIARGVGASRQTVAKKINDFISRGLIESFTVRLNPAMFDLNLKAYILIDIEPKKELRKRCGERIKRLHQITQFHYLFGRYDALAEAWAKDGEELTELIKTIHELEGVRETETFIVHDTIKNSPQSPFIGILKTR